MATGTRERRTNHVVRRQPAVRLGAGWVERARRPHEFGPLESHPLFDGVKRIRCRTWRDVVTSDVLQVLRLAVPPAGTIGRKALAVESAVAPEVRRLVASGTLLPPTHCHWRDADGRLHLGYIMSDWDGLCGDADATASALLW